MKTLKRNSCVICGDCNFKKVAIIKKTPIFMGTRDKSDSCVYEYEDLRFVSCNSCGNLQLSNLIPLEKLYTSNHNVGVVGTTWSNHFYEFAKFINENKFKSNILEIGCPSGKLVKKYLSINNDVSWTTTEPNPDLKSISDLPQNVKYVKKWLSGLTNDTKHDNIVLSHVFEHLYNPFQDLNKISSLLKKGGRLFISIPDMNHILDRKMLPPAGMNFEHTFYLDEKNLIFLFKRAGFKIIKKFNYINHSFFYCCEKTSESTENTDILKSHNNIVHNKFIDIANNYKNIAKQINKFIQKTNLPVYMYGAHFPAQLLFSFGVDKNKIKAVLDNSETKIGNILYGTDLTVYSPEVLKNEKCAVICHMGPYTEEIKNDILNNINSEVLFI